MTIEDCKYVSIEVTTKTVASTILKALAKIGCNVSIGAINACRGSAWEKRPHFVEVFDDGYTQLSSLKRRQYITVEDLMDSYDVHTLQHR